MSYNLRNKSYNLKPTTGFGAPDCNGSGNNPPSVTNGTAKSKSKSKTRSVASSITRKLAAENKLADKLAEIEREKLKQMLELEAKLKEDKARRELALELSRIDDEYPMSEEEEKDSEKEYYNKQRVTEWANNINIAELTNSSPFLLTKQQQPYSSSNDKLDQLNNAVSQIALNNEQLLKSTEVLISSKIKDDDKARHLAARQSTPRELPTFCGDSEEWPLFISQYYSTTKLCNYTAEENVIRLRKALTGSAKLAVHGLLIASDQADKVIEILQLRFGRPHQIINRILDRIKSISPLKPGKAENIIHLATEIQNLVVIVKSLNCNAHLSNPILINELTEKLLDFQKFNWSKTASKLKCYTLEDFSDWLFEEANSICHITTTSDSSVSYYSTSKIKRTHNQTVLSTTTSSATSNVRMTKVLCPVCKQYHRIWACEEYKKQTSKDKWNLIKEHKLCINCLCEGHQVKNCSSKNNCRIHGCNKRHHSSIHEVCSKNLIQSTSAPLEKSVVPSTSKSTVYDTVAFSDRSTSSVLLRILPVKIAGPKGEVATYALLDDASTVTLIEQDVADKIGATGYKETLNIKWTNNQQQSDLNSRRIDLEIRGETGEKFYLKNARTTRVLNLPLQFYNINSLKKKWDHFKNAPIPVANNTRPTILIGQDNCHLLLAQKIIAGPPHAPVLTLTKLGWTLHGNVSSCYDNNFTCHISHEENNNEDLHKLVIQSFSTEEFGVVSPTKTIINSDDERAMAIFNQTAKRIGDRWEVGLLWKKNLPLIPEDDSRDSALKRLYSIERKMDKYPEFGLKYDEKIQDFISKGYARKVNSEELSSAKRKFYLPHFGVQNPNKPGKVRPVFDAAAKCKGISLNDMLLKGPDLLNSLPGILVRFRQREIGFCADIKEMFPQVKIIREDQYSQLFLWRGWEREKDPDTYAMSSMTFGATSSPFTAQEVKNRNAKDFGNEFPEASKAIINKFYVDDYLDSAHNVEYAIQLIHDVIYILQKGGFQLCNWVTNSDELRNVIPEELRAVTKEFGENERVLGLMWNQKEDVFGFSLKFHKINPAVINGEQPPTKRTFLKVLMSIFDPLGFLSHFMIKGKILLQDIWRSGISWDDILPDKLLKKWENWRQQISKLTNFCIPRCFSSRIKDASDIQLHIFTDASERAFAAAAYLRIDCGSQIDVSLIMGRTRVAPLKFLSIPRLELQAAVMGTRLATTIKKEMELPINSIYFWTDSITVLSWIRSSERKYKVFIAHRIGEILDSTNVNQWHWVPTKDNVADDATRDCDIPDVTGTARWINGASFLRMSPDNWPKEKRQSTKISEIAQEEEVTYNISKQSNEILVRFSSWKKLIRITAWCRRFIKFTRFPCERQYRGSEIIPITIDELQEAEKCWEKISQEESFPEEITALKRVKIISTNSRLQLLSPYLDEQQLLRIKGRTVNSPELVQNTTCPVILDYKHPYTQLLLLHEHVKAAHQGVEHLFNEIRQKYWVIGLRNAIKKIQRECLICRIRRRKPLTQIMAPLPEHRLTRVERAFTFTGMDYFGPFFVTIGRKTLKRYGVLFTCLSVRAVHLELAASLDTDSAIMAIRRFASRRGLPEHIYSDNGTNLIGAEKELRNSLQTINQDKITNKLTDLGIQWHFIPPASPHMGGSWERLVQSVKRCLNAIQPVHRNLSEETLVTLFAEIENILNSRPLTHVSSDPSDPEALTPNHFLIGTRGALPSLVRLEDRDICLRKRWKIVQCLTNQFWKRWIREYLPTLTNRSKWRKEQDPIKIGDLVIIVDENSPRNTWPKGIVISLFPGKDRKTRVVDVRTGNSTYRRSINKLIVIGSGFDGDASVNRGENVADIS